MSLLSLSSVLYPVSPQLSSSGKQNTAESLLLTNRENKRPALHIFILYILHSVWIYLFFCNNVHLFFHDWSQDPSTVCLLPIAPHSDTEVFFFTRLFKGNNLPLSLFNSSFIYLFICLSIYLFVSKWLLYFCLFSCSFSCLISSCFLAV